MQNSALVPFFAVKLRNQQKQHHAALEPKPPSEPRRGGKAGSGRSAGDSLLEGSTSVGTEEETLRVDQDGASFGPRSERSEFEGMSDEERLEENLSEGQRVDGDESYTQAPSEFDQDTRTQMSGYTGYTGHTGYTSSNTGHNRPSNHATSKGMNIKVDINRGTDLAGDWWHRVPSPLDLQSIEPGMPVHDLKAKIQALTKIPMDEMLIKFNGEPLIDGKKVKHYGIKNGFHISLDLSKIGELRKTVRARDQTIWERDFEHNEQMQKVKSRALNSLVDDLALQLNPDLLGTRAKLVYLTQGQAQDIMTRMDDFIRAIHHRTPELVLKFFGSYGTQEDLLHGYNKTFTQFPFVNAVPEISSADQVKVEQQLQAFVHDIILPIAMNSSTVVFVEATRDCGLSAVVRRVLAPVADRLGEDCPFTLIGIASAAVVRTQSNDPESVAHRIKDSKLASTGQDNAWCVADEIQQRKSSAIVSVDEIEWATGTIQEGHEQSDGEGPTAPYSPTNAAAAGLRSTEGSVSPSLRPGATGAPSAQRGKRGSYVAEVVFFEEGMRVEARYWGFEKYYPGVISRDRGNGTYDIDYDDGERETGVASNMIRLLGLGPRAIKPSAATCLNQKSQELDLADGLSHYLIVEGPNTATFSHLYLSALATGGARTVAFQGFGIGDYKQLADYCFRDIPVILMDSRERFWTMPWPDEEVVDKPRTHLANKSLAFDSTMVADQLDSLDLFKQDRLIEDFEVAEGVMKRHLEVLQETGLRETYTAATLAFLHALLTPGKVHVPVDDPSLDSTMELFEAIRLAGHKRKMSLQGKDLGQEGGDEEYKEKLELVLHLEEYVSRYNDAFCLYGTAPQLHRWLFPYGTVMPSPPPRPISTGRPVAATDPYRKARTPDRGVKFGIPGMAEIDFEDEEMSHPELLEEQAYGTPASFIRDDESRMNFATTAGDSSLDVKEIVKAFHADLKDWHNVVGAKMENWQADRETAIAVKTILTSAATYSTSIFDLATLKRVVRQCTEPHFTGGANAPSYETLLLLRDAWDAVDIYHHIAGKFKRFAYNSYFLLLLVGILTVGASMLTEDRKWDYISEENFKRGVICASVLLACLFILVIFFNPTSKWHGLRSAALHLESEIFKFRCRVGEYHTRHSDPAAANASGAAASVNLPKHGNSVLSRQGSSATALGENPVNARMHTESLRHAIISIRKGVTDSGYLKLSARDKEYPSFVYTHFQRPVDTKCCFGLCSCSCCSLCARKPKLDEVDFEEGDVPLLPDLHFSYMSSREYLHHRLDVATKRYQARIPRYTRARLIAQLVTVVGSISGVALAMLNYTHWIVMIVVCTISMSAWMQYHGTARKISRYSTLITELENVKTWWRSLSLREQMSPEHTQKLVLVGESILSDERSSWASESKVESLKYHMGRNEHRIHGASTEQRQGAGNLKLAAI